MCVYRLIAWYAIVCTHDRTLGRAIAEIELRGREYLLYIRYQLGWDQIAANKDLLEVRILFLRPIFPKIVHDRPHQAWNGVYECDVMQ